MLCRNLALMLRYPLIIHMHMLQLTVARRDFVIVYVNQGCQSHRIIGGGHKRRLGV